MRRGTERVGNGTPRGGLIGRGAFRHGLLLLPTIYRLCELRAGRLELSMEFVHAFERRQSAHRPSREISLTHPRQNVVMSRIAVPVTPQS